MDDRPTQQPIHRPRSIVTLDAARGTDTRHVVDVLIEERARHLLDMPVVWPLIKAVFFPLLHYKAAKRMADEVRPMGAAPILNYLLDILDLDLRITGTEHIPPTGRLIIVANHPTGIVDGVALFKAMEGVRQDITYFANRDALRVCPNLEEMLIPVEWVEDRRTRAKTRETLLLARQAFHDDRVVVIFPSGRLGHMTLRGIRERPWLPTTLNLMRRHDAPILPVHIQARNSILYYILHFLSNELRDMTLFNEMLNKVGKTYHITFGPLIMPDQLMGVPEDEIRRLQAHVENRMGPGRNPPFE